MIFLQNPLAHTTHPSSIGCVLLQTLEHDCPSMGKVKSVGLYFDGSEWSKACVCAGFQKLGSLSVTSSPSPATSLPVFAHKWWLVLVAIHHPPVSLLVPSQVFWSFLALILLAGWKLLSLIFKHRESSAKCLGSAFSFRLWVLLLKGSMKQESCQDLQYNVL